MHQKIIKSNRKFLNEMRLFVAIDLDESIRENISRFSNKLAGLSGIKAVEKGNLHITLQFLGEVDKSRVELIKEELSKVKFTPFKIKLAKVGGFPSIASPRVVWIDVVEGKEELTMLANEVSTKLKKLGFRRDKDFVAHVTVARVKRKNPMLKDVISEFVGEEFGEMVVDKIKLKQSILRPQGPIYKDVGVFGP